MGKHLTLHDAITASGRYLDREHHPELTPEVIDNLTETNNAINAFLDDVGYTGPRDCTSGFRPSGVNAALSNSGKASGHMVGMCEDLKDQAGQPLAKLCAANPEKLRKHGLMMEDPDYTKKKVNGVWQYWVHLDRLKRVDRPSRVFIPFAVSKNADGEAIMVAQELPDDDESKA